MTAILIPARGGSARIPNKNSKKLNGHPLIAYRLVVAKRVAGLLSGEVCTHVATDDCRVSEIALGYGVPVLTREYAGPNQADIVWLQEILPRLPSAVDIIIILRPTSPFLSAETIVAAHTEFVNSAPPADSLRTIRPVREHPGKMWMYYESNRVLPILPWLMGPSPVVPAHSLPTQALPTVYVQTAGLEITRRTTIDGGSLAGVNVMPYELGSWNLESLDINTDEDWAQAERAAAHLPQI